MDTTDFVVLVLLAAALLGLSWMMCRPRPYTVRGCDPVIRRTIALRNGMSNKEYNERLRVERDLSLGEPRRLTPERLAAWRADKKSKIENPKGA